MRTLVTIDDRQIAELDRLAKQGKTSRAAVIRDAIDGYIAGRKPTPAGRDEAFGIWADRDIDGLEYQDRLRSEW